jgi:hypothetical protein
VVHVRFFLCSKGQPKLTLLLGLNLIDRKADMTMLTGPVRRSRRRNSRAWPGLRPPRPDGRSAWHDRRPGQPKSTPAVIAMATIAAATQSTVRQNGGHQRVLFYETGAVLPDGINGRWPEPP